MCICMFLCLLTSLCRFFDQISLKKNKLELDHIPFEFELEPVDLHANSYSFSS